MICEYALEPELVATWHRRSDFRHFIEQFGFGSDGHATGRVVTQYPKKWREQVWRAFDTNFGRSALRGDRERVTELLRRLTIPKMRRSGSAYNDQCTWLKNAEDENTRRRFHAILARDNPRNNPQVMREDDVLEMEPPPLWRVPREIPVLRTAASMTKHLEPMLRCATRILFVDPHFRPSEPRWQNPLREFLNIICDGSRQVTLEYHTGDTISSNLLQRDCQQHLPSLIPRDFTLTVFRWKNRDIGEEDIGEELHNRYILTDIGGVDIPNGLDERDRGTIDISRLSFETWQQRLEDYGYYHNPASSEPKSPSFDLEGRPIVIIGSRNIR